MSLLNIHLPDLNISAIQLRHFDSQNAILQLGSDAISINVRRCSARAETDLPLEWPDLPLVHSERSQELLVTRTINDTSDS